MTVLIIFILATILICTILFLSIKNIDYLQKFKQNSYETIANIKYIYIDGQGDNRVYLITISYFDKEENKYISEKKEYVLRPEFKVGETISIRYLKSNPNKCHFSSDFETIEKPKN